MEPDPRALKMAEHFMTCDDIMAWYPDTKQEHDWVEMIRFVLDVFMECVRLASNQPIQSREQINFDKLPFILDRIEGCMGMQLHLIDLNDAILDEATQQNIDATGDAPVVLVAQRHLPLNRWFYINKPLQVMMTFTRLWTVGR